MPIDWDRVRENVHFLYMVQRRPLREVDTVMRQQYGFKASARSYKKKFKEWGYTGTGTHRRPLGRLEAQQGPPESGRGMLNVVDALQSLDRTIVAPNRFELYGHTAIEPSLNPISPSQWTFLPAAGEMLQGIQSSQNHASMPDQSSSSPSLNNFAFPSADRVADPNIWDSNRRTPLHHAVISGSILEVKRLISLGASVDIPDQDGDRPIHHAAIRGFTAILLHLLKSGADIDAHGHGGKTSLHLSVKWPETLKALLQKRSIVSIQDDNGDTPLHLAVNASSFTEAPKRSAIGLLIKSKANVNMLNNLLRTPFHSALAKSRSLGTYYTSYIVMFLTNEADIFLRTETNRTPFEVFLDESVETLRFRHTRPNSYLDWKLFLAKRADVDVQLKSGELLIDYVLNKCNLESDSIKDIVEIICSTANVNASTDGEFPLHCFLQGDYSFLFWVEKLDDWFIKRGANLNQVDHAGKTPLLIHLERSKYRRNPKIVRLLLDAGADPSKRDDSGKLPIYAAIRNMTERQYREDRDIAVMLLNASLWKEMPHRLFLGIEGDPKDQLWWARFYHLYSQPSWFDPKTLTELTPLLPVDIADHLSKVALEVLANKFVDMVKTGFETAKITNDQQRQVFRHKITSIIRDCRSLKIEVDDAWYDLLLDTQDRDFP